jgi:hypothetical protein
MSNTVIHEQITRAVAETFKAQIESAAGVDEKSLRTFASRIVRGQTIAEALAYIHEMAYQDALETLDTMTRAAGRERYYLEWRASVAQFLAEPEFAGVPHTARWREAFDMHLDGYGAIRWVLDGQHKGWLVNEEDRPQADTIEPAS